MDEYNQLDTYNGDTVHDMNVDYDFNENTGELPEYLEGTDMDDFIDNLNDWD